MALSEVITFKVSPAIRAQLEIEAREREITIGAIVRAAVISCLETGDLTELDRDILQRETKRRLRDMVKGKPMDIHDGIMLVKQVWDVIEKEKKSLRECSLLTADDYDSFIRLVEQNKEVAKTYEDGDRLVTKFDTLIERLKQERENAGG